MENAQTNTFQNPPAKKSVFDLNLIEEEKVVDPGYSWLNWILPIPKVLFLSFVVFIAYSFFSRFFYVDIANGCYIKMLPSWDFNFNTPYIKKGLVVLKNADLDEYKNVCSKIGLIDPNFDCGSSEGGCYWRGDPTRISVSTENSTLAWVAGVIAHETCHATQDLEKRSSSEEECYAVNDKVLQALVKY